jgi:hypothetical protein
MDGQELGRVKVNYKPLHHGYWDGTYWKDDQEARASNDFSIDPPGGSFGALQWIVVADPSLADPETEQNAITFNVSWDQPGDDPILEHNVGNGRITNLLADPKQAGADVISNLYIAHPRKATRPFTVVILGAQPIE